MKHIYNTIMNKIYIYQNVFCNIIKLILIKLKQIYIIFGAILLKKNFLLDINYFLGFQIYTYYVYKILFFYIIYKYKYY